MENLIMLFISAALVNNFVLTKFLGICPFLGVSKKTNTAFGMGVAVTFVMLVAGVVTWLIYHLILVPLGLVFLEIVSFILVIASLVQLMEMFMKRFHQGLFKSFGIFLCLITTNCAILGLAILNIMNNHSFVEAVVFSLGAGIGFTLALVIMSGIRERLELADLPYWLKGAPITLIIAGILALAFMGFGGII